MKWVAWLNLIGVLALVGLCVIQWKENSRLNLRAIDLEKTKQEQMATIAERNNSIKAINADLDDFRNRLQLAGQTLAADEKQISTLRVDRDRAIADDKRAEAERDQLKTVVTQWETAVKQRDEALKQAGENLTAAGSARDEAIKKFNDLAGKYNGLVKDLNDARAKLAGR